jgi:hypothetical protein
MIVEIHDSSDILDLVISLPNSQICMFTNNRFKFIMSSVFFSVEGIDYSPNTVA